MMNQTVMIIAIVGPLASVALCLGLGRWWRKSSSSFGNGEESCAPESAPVWPDDLPTIRQVVQRNGQSVVAYDAHGNMFTGKIVKRRPGEVLVQKDDCHRTVWCQV